MKLKIDRKTVLIILIVLASLLALGAAFVFGINAWVVYSGEKYLLAPEEAATLSDVDCILVLGCGVMDDGRPSHMLEDRLKRGVSLYQDGAAPKLLMSGDHGRVNYDEVNTMKQYAIDAQVPAEDVFMDHAGFSTYESMYRAKDIFCADKIIIVSQQYHLYRAIYIARALGIEAYGVAADYRSYSGQLYRDIREILARDKDFFVAMFQLDYPYGGETIPVSGNGNLTNDK